MTKHLADHRTPSDTVRRANFWAIEQRREDAPLHKSIRSLSQRPQPRTDTIRLRHYLRIERGVQA
jgi:hypothetical protein